MTDAEKQFRIQVLKKEREKAMCRIETHPQAAWMVIAELNSIIFKLEGHASSSKKAEV